MPSGPSRPPTEAHSIACSRGRAEDSASRSRNSASAETPCRRPLGPTLRRPIESVHGSSLEQRLEFHRELDGPPDDRALHFLPGDLLGDEFERSWRRPDPQRGGVVVAGQLMKAVENLVVEILWRQLAQDHVVDAGPDLGQAFAVEPLDVLGQRAGDVCKPAGGSVGKAVIVPLEHHHRPRAAPTVDARAERACGNPALPALKKVRDQREIGSRIRRLREDAAGRLVANVERAT